MGYGGAELGAEAVALLSTSVDQADMSIAGCREGGVTVGWGGRRAAIADSCCRRGDRNSFSMSSVMYCGW